MAPPWRVNTPIKSDVTIMLEKMMKIVEGELSEEDLMWFGDTLPPNVQHWGRALKFVGTVVLFPVALGVAIALPPVTLGVTIGSAAVLLSATLALPPVLLGAGIGMLALTVGVGGPIYLVIKASDLVRWLLRTGNRKAQSDGDALEAEEAPSGLNDNSALQIETQTGTTRPLGPLHQARRSIYEARDAVELAMAPLSYLA